MGCYLVTNCDDIQKQTSQDGSAVCFYRHDQNDINEDTAMQLELINQSLAELRAKPKESPRRPIGFGAKY